MNQYMKNLRTGVAALTTSWSAVAPAGVSRSCLIVKNTSATEVVHLSTNASDPSAVPEAGDVNFYPLLAGEVLAFDKGLAPTVLYGKGATGAATLALIVG